MIADITEGDQVRLAPGVVMRRDRTRDQWILQAPERVLVLDEIAVDVLRVCTEQDTNVGAGIDRLAAQFTAPRDEIAGDVLELLRSMRERGFILS